MAALAIARVLNANDLFKQQYGRTLRWAAGLSLVALTVLVLTMPEFRPTPYALPDNQEIILQEMEVLRPPVDKPRDEPKRTHDVPIVEPSPDPEALDTVEMPDLIDILTPEPVWDDGADTPFVATSEKPRLIQGARADYPEMARLAGVQGLVMVKVLVGIDGRVEQVDILKGVHPLIDRPALAAARQLVFQPGTQRTVPVPCWVAVPFRFSLD